MLLCGLIPRRSGSCRLPPRALSQARQALDLCDTLRPTQGIGDYQQGFIKLLSAVSDPALLNDFMHDTLGCLIEPGRKAPWLMLETLRRCCRRTATWCGPPTGWSPSQHVASAHPAHEN